MTKVRLGIFSDLHLEFDDHAKREYPLFNKYDADIWLNAGDTHPRKIVRDRYAEDFEGRPYVEIMGNHDYWKNEIPINHEDACGYTEIDGVTIACAPLWTDLSNPFTWMAFKNFMVDYRRVLIKGEKLRQDYMCNVHSKHKAFLNEWHADIIMTHHLPSFQSVHPRWTDNDCNACFASNTLETLSYRPKLWIHGHTHDPCEYDYEGCKVICHPRGYPGEEAHANYKPRFIDMEF